MIRQLITIRNKEGDIEVEGVDGNLVSRIEIVTRLHDAKMAKLKTRGGETMMRRPRGNHDLREFTEMERAFVVLAGVLAWIRRDYGGSLEDAALLLRLPR